MVSMGCGQHFRRSTKQLRIARRCSWLAHFGAALLLQLSLSPIGSVVGQTIIWEDNFDGTSLNETVWEAELGNGCDLGEGLCGWGNDELQTYTKDNFEVSGGELRITARREQEQVDERWYTSSRIRSIYPIAAFLTGRFEASIKIPQGQGLWPAFWMLPANTSRGFWAATGEIDIMEAVNEMDAIFGTIHYGGEYPGNNYAGCMMSFGANFSDDYHTYALEWEQTEMRWYVDDVLYCVRTKWSSHVDDNEPFEAPFDTEFEILLNVAVGGNWPGDEINNNSLPAQMAVDYVRVYEIHHFVTEVVSEPFLGAPLCLPGTVEAEMFDTGGDGIGLQGNATTDLEPYRLDGHGRVENSSGSGRVHLSLEAGEWAAYTVSTEEVSYRMYLEIEAQQDAYLQLLLGDDANCLYPSSGTALTPQFSLNLYNVGETFGRWYTYEPVTRAIGVAGTHRMLLCVLTGSGIKIDRITFGLDDPSYNSSLGQEGECATSSSQSRPYMFGQPWAIPGYIEAEFYDYGGLGLGFHDGTRKDDFGGTSFRPADAVDISESGKDTSHGLYVSYWESGEWLAFTAHAEQGGVWDVMAAVASEENGTSSYRLLSNAVNCSSSTTDGFDGLGDDGMDLLGGPVTCPSTESWEAFRFCGKPDVFIPAGTHRLLFCRETGTFNVDYIYIFTPTPTPPPTPSPTLAPTEAPVSPRSDRGDFTWVYISLGCVLGLAALARLGYIVYRQEHWRRKSRAQELYDMHDGSSDSPQGTAKSLALATTKGKGKGKGKDPPGGGSGGGSKGGRVTNGVRSGSGSGSGSRSKSGSGSGSGSKSGLGARTGSGSGRIGVTPAMAAATAALVGKDIEDDVEGGPLTREAPSDGGLVFGSSKGFGYSEHGAGSRGRSRAPRASQAPCSDDEPLPRVLPRASSWSTIRQAAYNHPRSPSQSTTTSTEVAGAFASSAGLLSRHHRQQQALSFAAGGGGSKRDYTFKHKVQPATSPLTGSFEVRPDIAYSSKLTPRQAAGIDVSVGGSLWDRSTTSPMKGEANPQTTATTTSSAATATTATTTTTTTSNERDLYEEALLRAVQKQWSGTRSSTSGKDGQSPRSHTRSVSLTETPNNHKKDAMLKAGRCWTCICNFENSAGQTSCVGCGRIAPAGQATGRGMPIRQSSWLPHDIQF